MWTDGDSRRKRKVAEISQALNVTPVDVAALRRMAISEGGLLTDEIRCKVWPRLLNVPTDTLPEKPEEIERENNKDYNQVLLDVQRSLKRFPPGMPDKQREGLQEELIDIILRVLGRNTQLHYYQGYHDIVVTFLLVLDERLATALVEKLSTHHLRDFMDPTMDNTKHILNYLMPIIERINPEVHDFMQQAEVGTIFALSWLITWFGHVLSDFRHVVRLYDFFLACHPLMPIYFAAVIVLYREDEVLDCECDMASVHHLLSQIPQDLPYETLISRAGDLFVQFPPSELAREAAQQYSQQTAASTFKDFDLVSEQQRPDSVLRRRLREKQALEGAAAGAMVAMAQPTVARRFVRLAVMGLTVALGAAALTLVNTALEWVPKLDLHLFP
ncbi:TBC1 domain family member 20 isoform X2 [Oncorhynchus kisutch]|uniref:TBC1 domain family member 20 isoform X2 n=1 Tax=Oncorhynchus kisutch TaxID=8019 RepID=UPI0009A09E5F|nr:TBC1 domain family member 20 isoform X2 [Oncorhynchus kisutch]XP_035653200.1 TBC1 domain family member 20-like isoform X2 [Oncorhynchus keta]XP_046197809.1 TBC1 domain family member 20-like isoform X2 [Oncorhynchus gorbuscha]